MQFVSGERSSWIYTLIFTSLQLCGRLFASTSSPTLPPPSLNIHLRLKDSVILSCEVPNGHHGVVFMLFKVQKEVASQKLQSSADKVQFEIAVEEGESDQLFCCLYKDQAGLFSAFSPYLQLKSQREAVPTCCVPSLPPPVLTVEPSTGMVKRGDMLSFSCLVPAPPPQSQSQSGNTNKPIDFLLMRNAYQTKATSVILQPPASQVASSEPKPGVFTVGPVTGGEEGEYTCIYQINKRRRLVNSTVSNMVKIKIADMLPLPALVLQQQTDVWHMVCTGSPAYPGAVFYLYLADNEHPIDTYHAKVTHHQATFPVPVQDMPLVFYQCQYSVLLGNKWSNSELSLHVAVTRGIPPPLGLSGVDWPLVMGSFVAVVLFLCLVLVVAVVMHKKAAEKKKKKRHETQFWTRTQPSNPNTDRLSFNLQEMTDTDRPPRSPLWNSHSTFTSPIC